MRYFLARNSGGAVVSKQVANGDDAKIDAEINAYKVSQPSLVVTEVDEVMFDATPMDAATITTDQRTAAVDQFLNDPAPINKVERAAALVVEDRVNIIHQWLMDFKVAVVDPGTTSLAILKTRVGALPNLPQFTPADIKVAIQNKINAGGPAD